MIWSLVFLVCDPSACVAMSGPITKTEEECLASLPENAAFVEQQWPFSTIISHRCIAWGSEA